MSDEGLKPPAGWGADELTSFLHTAAQNRWATFAHYPAAVADMSRIDAVFMRLDGLVDPPNLVTPHMAIRCHSAFRVTCEHALAGQVGDMFPAVRSCLEAAAYAVHIHGSKELTEAWLRRHDNEETMKRLRGKEFHHSAVVETVAKLSPELGALFSELYQQAIDMGGHPNERGLTVNVAARQDDGGKHYDQISLHGDGPVLRFGLHSAVETGAAAIGMLRLIFAEHVGGDTEEDQAFRRALKRGRAAF